MLTFFDPTHRGNTWPRHPRTGAWALALAFSPLMWGCFEKSSYWDSTVGASTSGRAGEGGASSSSPEVAGSGTAAGNEAGAGGAVCAPSNATFYNPLNESFGSDPWMLYYEGYYYLAATEWMNNRLTMKRGRTMQELIDAEVEVIFDALPVAASRDHWAPEFHLLDNGAGELRWYFYFTAGTGAENFTSQATHVLESDGLDPMGPYTFKATVLLPWAIDASVLKFSGNLYILYSAWDGPTQNVYLRRLDNPWTASGSRLLLTKPEYPWEQEGSAQVNEGPAALYHDGRTFVTYSASQCGSPGYKLGLLELVGNNPMSQSSWWKSPLPVFEAASGQYGTAHNGFFLSPDGTENWIVYHGVTSPAGSCGVNRTSRAQPFTWNADGTPNFGEPLALDTEIPVPSGEGCF